MVASTRTSGWPDAHAPSDRHRNGTGGIIGGNAVAAETAPASRSREQSTSSLPEIPSRENSTSLPDVTSSAVKTNRGEHPDA